ncbi:hypothetical protein AJ80_08791 [Polytolypa hystricis UAMH7299]|uniref:histidine kinase n=1 Tax=Polytolypa hystricis (strain UAMH7299) TaxID=1447883 RepID=A0A2B7X227_POLH7|nr:hypothetical protein AJ80_08791 [Polytolypa hystricis UAMH7299]
MAESSILGDDLPLPPRSLFERLSHIPGYTWDSTSEPIHSSYDHWHVLGFRHVAYPDSQPFTPSTSNPSISHSKPSSSAHPSPRFDSKTSFRSHWRSSASEASSDLSSHQHEVDPSPIPVIARVSSHVIRLEREFHMLRSIIDTSDPECRHTVRPIDLVRLTPEASDRGPLLVTLYESPGVNDLRELVHFGPAFFEANTEGRYLPREIPQVPLSKFLDFAIGACECLELLHYGLRTIHGEIRADSFHFNQETGAVRLSNTGNGARSFDNALSEGWSKLSRQVGVKHKLQFIAPEQTGRMLTELDSRTDIYALGVLFWSMVAGRPAFDGDDLIEVVQNVLSKALPPIATIRMDIPASVSAVIQRMTRKQINDRYHTISSVKWDLQQISKLLGDGDRDRLNNFQIAQRDVSSFFTLPAEMFGRKEEYNKVLDVVSRVQKRLQSTPPQSAAKSSLQSLYALSSGSSVSGGRLDEVEIGDASSDSGSLGITLIKSNTGGPSNALGHTSTQESNQTADSSTVCKTMTLPSRVKGPIDQRENNDRDSYLSMNSSIVNSASTNSASMNVTAAQLESFAALGRRKIQAQYRTGGRCEIISILGTGGMGKSDLIHRLKMDIRKHGYVAVSRHDRSRRLPFEPFFKTFSSLLSQVFSERDVTTDTHSAIRAILQPVWDSLHLILELPEQILFPLAAGNQPITLPKIALPLQVVKENAEESSTLPETEFVNLSRGNKTDDFAQGPSSAKILRFTEIFIDVLRILSTYKLICIFLDDIQYADAESTKLLLEIVKARIRCVLVVTSRPDEGICTDLKSLLHSEAANVTVIELKPLNEDDILKYVAATMHQPPTNALLPLAAVVQEKSRGIPFYVRMMLETCYRKNCLWYSWRDYDWQYDLDRIFTEFVAPTYGEGLGNDFIAKRFQELPQESRSILLWAALLGSPFSFSLVKKLLSGEFLYATGEEDKEDITCPRQTPLTQSEADIVVGLQFLMQSGILLAGETDDEYRFAHDRYAQAVASMKQCHNQEKMHFIVAQALIKYGGSEDSTLYSRANHISLASRLIRRQVPNRIKYRNVLYHAALRASESGARSTAVGYYQACIYLLQDDPWDDNANDAFYEETLELHILTADLLLFQGETSEATKLLDAILAHGQSAACKARAWMMKSRLYASSGDIKGALDALFTCLDDLGVNMRHPMSWEECDAAYFKLSAYLKDCDLETLFSRPLSRDRTLLAIGAVMSEAMAVCIWGEPMTFLRVGVEMMNIYIFRGAFSQIAYLCTHLSMIALSRFKDLELGIKLSDGAADFLSEYDDPWIAARGVAIHNFFVNHLRVPMCTTLPLLERSMEAAFVLGERYLTLLSVSALVFFRFSLGHDMAEVESLCNYAPEEVNDWESDMRGGVYITSIRQAARALQGKTYISSPDQILSDGKHNCQEYLSYITSRDGNTHALNLHNAMTLVTLYYYGYHERVVELGTKMLESLRGVWSLRPAALTYFYLSLALLSLHLEDPNRPGLEAALEQIKVYKKEIDFRRDACDANYGMWSLLVDALIYEVNNNTPMAIRTLEAALDHTQLHNWPLEEALTLELQSEFLARRGAKTAAQSMLKRSISAWNRINATGKARHLAEKHEWLLRTGIPTTNDVGCQTVDSLLSVPPRNAVQDQPMHPQDNERNREWLEQNQDRSDQGTLDIPGASLDIIDMSSILEFSQVMSSELQIDKLLTRMVSIILESCSGSELALVITEFESHGWCVAASGDHENGEEAYLEGLPFSEVEDKMAQQITHFTLRTQEQVLVHNVLEDERFSNVSGAYFARNPQGRSVIAMPLVQGNNFLGVIHIEGKPNSFTQRNLVVLRLVCNQVGISLANAFLFQEARRVSAANAAMVEAQKRSLKQAREAEYKAKLAEAEANRNVKLKDEAAKAKSIFLANISHDLRTPMNGVIGLSELLKGTSLDREQDGYVESIRVCADTLLTLINDILDFSKLEAGKMKVSTVPLNLRETIAEVVRALRYTHRDRGLETIEDLDGVDPLLLVLGDPVRLHQIFMNLLSNSYKFTPKGSVTVKAKVDRDDGERIRVTCSVSDTGIGIPSEQFDRLFRPFSQADSSTARSYGGSGLGLSICKAIIEDVLGGKIWLQSKLGVGTTVSFVLDLKKAPNNAVAKTPWSQYTPLEKKQQNQKPAARDLSLIPRDRIRVCIAEDNPINQKIAVTFVKKLGLQGEAYSDGQQAVDALKLRAKEGNPFHVVLMDVQMPVLDGYNAARKIRLDEDNYVNSVLVIAMTASAIKGDREKCIEAGMNNYLAKPVRLDVLRTILDRYLAPVPMKLEAQQRRRLQRKGSYAATIDEVLKHDKALKHGGEDGGGSATPPIEDNAVDDTGDSAATVHAPSEAIIDPPENDATQGPNGQT